MMKVREASYLILCDLRASVVDSSPEPHDKRVVA